MGPGYRLSLSVGAVNIVKSQHPVRRSGIMFFGYGMIGKVRKEVKMINDDHVCAGAQGSW